MRPTTGGMRGVVLVLALVSPACGELTAGGVGQAEVLVSGGPLPTDSVPGTAASAAAMDVEATVTAILQVFVAEGEDGRFQEVTDGPTTVTVDARGEMLAELASEAVPIASYTRLRLVYQSVTAAVQSGLVIDGQPVEGTFRVRFESDQARRHERAVDLSVRDGETSTLQVALNSAAWLRQANADTREVPSDRFHDSVGARSRDKR